MSQYDLFDSRPLVKKKRLNVLPENPEAMVSAKLVGSGRFPSWLHRKLPKGGTLWKTGDVLEENHLHTVCEEAKCPNLLECWSKKTATFLAMGQACTRSCGFCAIDFSKQPKPLDPQEPIRIAISVKKLQLKHAVITMVARDDLPDGGALHLKEIILQIQKESPLSTIEVLTSDFNGNLEGLERVLESGPTVFNHNIETVRRLTPRVRHKASYDRTLSVLRHASLYQGKQKILIKSGLMVGFGEKEEEVHETLADLKSAGVDIITIGQYLQADPYKLLVKEFVTPKQFAKYEEYGRSIGISHLFCGPFVRSSYNAAELISTFEKNSKDV